MVFDLCADDQGYWNLRLPKPDAVTAAGEAALSLWAEESLFVQMPAHAMGCVMRLSSALGYMLVRAALDGELTEHAFRYRFLLLHVIYGVPPVFARVLLWLCIGCQPLWIPCRATRSLSFCLVLRAIGAADGGSAGRRNWWHLLFGVLNTRGDGDGGMALLRHNKSYIFLNWCVSRDPKLSTPRV